jgi:phospholipid transport system transporter-binding protein
MAAAATLALPQRLTLAEAGATLARLGGELARQPDATVVVHAGALEVFDSAALSVLLELRRRLLEQGKAMSVSGWPRRLEDLATLYGVHELLPSA